jgi:hypothetical protein
VIRNPVLRGFHPDPSLVSESVEVRTVGVVTVCAGVKHVLVLLRAPVGPGPVHPKAFEHGALTTQEDLA